MDREAWRAEIDEVAKSRTQLSDWIELNWTELLWFSNLSKLSDWFMCSSDFLSGDDF